MLYIAIGRNAGKFPMTTEDWGNFQYQVRGAISSSYGSPDTVAHGVSSYEDMPEDTCVFVWFDVNDLSAHLEIRLGAIAKYFGQDSIAWSVSETRFTSGV